ncbi:MAG: YDG domain-containing protein [Clostridia bacterium]|nr:YDG domain-containing protein [Clostridia bacterium]
MQKAKKTLLILGVLLILGMIQMPSLVMAVGTENIATATSREYNGTNTVDVTDVIFKDVFEGDDVSAVATGILDSADVGNYNIIKLVDIVLTGEDSGWYEISTVLLNVKTNVNITKVKPIITVKTEAKNGEFEKEEVVVTATITNTFNRLEGLPTAEQFIIKGTNATLKAGTKIIKKENTYTATFIIDDNTNRRSN